MLLQLWHLCEADKRDKIDKRDKRGRGTSRLLTQLLNYAYYYERTRLIQVSWLNLNFTFFFPN